MARKFSVGDHVTWNSEAGRVSGTIIKVPTKNIEQTKAGSARRVRELAG